MKEFIDLIGLSGVMLFVLGASIRGGEGTPFEVVPYFILAAGVTLIVVWAVAGWMLDD